MAKPRHFLDIAQLDADILRALLDDAARRKAARIGWHKGRPDADAPLKGQVLACVFEKPSTRTRVSFDMAMRQLGGEALIMNAAESQIGRGEPPEDTARVLAGYVDGIMLRARRHETLLALASVDKVPVINGLTDRTHPCQIMADLLTIEERVGALQGLRLAWIGDGNNVCASFIEAAPKFGFELVAACPELYSPDQATLARGEGCVQLVRDPKLAVRNADAVITDVWVSMGDEDQDQRHAALAGYQVDEALMDEAAPHAIFLHCLPAHRGEEVSAQVMDGPRSAVWAEAENRLHAQKAILAWAMG